jgi:carboxymethylenebutenolidase
LAEDIQLEIGGTRRTAHLALPAGPGPHPGVVVIHDITGFREDTRRHCGRFAQAGYAAIAPDLYDGLSPGCVFQTLLSLARERGGALEVVAAARARLVACAGVAADRVGVVGFCMGGGFALLAAADGAYAVAVPFYGTVPRDPGRLDGLCPTIAFFGERDLPFRSHARRLASHLAALGVPSEVHVLAGVGHSFMNDHPDALFAMGTLTPLRARYDPDAEGEAWRRMLDFLARHGMGAA